MTYRLGLIGHPVKHSLSPPMHEAALQFFGLEGSYELLDVPPEKLATAVRQFVDDGFCGFNVTIPHKEGMFKLAGHHTPEAATAGAANTIRVAEGGTLTAHNTDIAGLERALISALGGDCDDEGASVAPVETACVIGAGGAARAALIALCRPPLSCKKIIVIARDIKKAEQAISAAGLDESVEVRSLPALPMIGDNVSLIVQTTPIGQGTTEVPGWLEHVVVQETSRSTTPLFFDLVYARDLEETPLVRFACQRGWNAIDGTDMLVHQACLAFEFWTGHLPPFDLMKAALNQARRHKSN